MTGAAALLALAAQATTQFAFSVEFDRGRGSGLREFQSADRCMTTPCVVTHDGAIRFRFDPGEPVEIDAAFLHEGNVSPILLFEKREREDYAVFERIFHPHRNKRTWDIRSRIERHELETLYLFGLTQQYRIDDGDPIVIEVRSLREPSQTRQYFFRYYATGTQLGCDVAIVFPLNVYPPPEEDTTIRYLGPAFALTVSVGWNMDPERRYTPLVKLAHALHPVVIAGVLSRDVLRDSASDDVWQMDLLLGGGLQFLDFLVLGYGASVIHEPRVGAALLGLNLAALGRVLDRLNDTRSADWDAYLNAEKRRTNR